MKLHKAISWILTLVVLLGPVAVQAEAVGGGFGEVPCFGLANCVGFTAAVTGIINIFLLIVGLIAAVMLIIGGIRYVVSQGDDEQLGKAKNTILYALIGLIVIGLSAVIVNFVLGALENDSSVV